MTLDDFELLCSEEAKSCIKQNIERTHTDVALDKCLGAQGRGFAALIAEQVKYLQRSRKKLPSYYDAGCIVVGRSYEQSSSEYVAAAKCFGGGLEQTKSMSVLDLTCGLGVDSFAMSKRFGRVVAIERDELFAAVAKENFSRLGADNIEVVNSSAEDFLAKCVENGVRFDFIYCDPDRRGSNGRKKVVLEDCSPNLIALQSVLKRVSDMLVVKCSPLFDVDEAFKIYGECCTAVEVVSTGDECKEVVVYASLKEGGSVDHAGEICANSIEKGAIWREKRAKNEKNLLFFDEKRYKFLVIPDVSLQKSRLARVVLESVCDIWSDNGYGFSVDDPNVVLGRVYEIEAIYKYEPKRIKRALKEIGVDRAEILKREFPYGAEQVVKQLGLKGSGARKIAVTAVLNELYAVVLKG